ncbi:hypothetical protein Zmor_007787 [Zophobas morio]|uniref:DNA repair protein RAD50 n=1 Tax=Zophobas morio TaxID=2755281 RepID=A0AA38MQ22_9CUCU|nr:hypothetical protein Zmor_007787 [Zophobas morio]
MATLTRLQISGIRSFGPYEEHSQQIKFGTPVTLILGQNGCGKTTIIESLKYACSAELPGGTNSGQGFVHDPKISRTSSTKGNIKLQFLDPRNNEITIARVVEVSQTEKQMKFSTKDSTLRRLTPTGNTSSISGRCADITTECCQLMNVTPAVLNNVIFCHQENSLWPLDEGKKLKEKFDEIFDAQKYNKCTELFRKHCKTKHLEVKFLENELKNRKEKKDYVNAKTQTLQDKETKLEGLASDIETKDEELSGVRNRMNEILELEGTLSQLQTELATKETMKNGIVEEQKTIKKGLAFEFEGSDEDLRNKINTFENDRQKEESLISNLETRKSEIESKNKVIANATQEAQTELGILKEQKNQYEQKCVQRTNLIKEARNEMKVKDLKEFQDNDGARAALSELNAELENQEICLASLIDEKDEVQKNLQNKIDKVREKTVATKQKKLSKEGEVQQCEKKVIDITGELIALTTSDSLMEDMKKRIESIDKTVHSLNSTFKEAEESKKIDTYKADIQGMERQLESLDSEHKTLQQNDVIEGKMESEKHLIIEKQKEINRIKSKHSDNFRQLFEGTVPERNLKDSVVTKQKTADTLFKTLTNDINIKQKEVTTLEVQRNNQSGRIADYEKELKTNRAKISEACSGRDFEETFNSTFQKKERLQIDKGQYRSVRIIYGQFIKKFEEQAPCCPVCETDFSNKSTVVQKIISTLKSKVERVPQQLTRVESELEKEEALYSKLQQLKLVNEETEVLEKEKLPQLKQTLSEIEDKLSATTSELNQLKTRLTEPQKILDLCGRVISDVGSLDQSISDVEKSQRTVDNLKQSLVEVASKKSKEEVAAEIDHIKFEVSESRGKVETITKNINKHKDRIQNLMQERKEVVEKQLKLRDGIQNRPLLETQQAELTDKVGSLQEEITQLSTQLNAEEIDLQNAIENKNTTTQRDKQEVDEQRQKVINYRRLLTGIDKLQTEIDDYLKKGITDKLTTIEEKLKEYKNKETALEVTKTKILETISEKRENLAKEELRFRTLQSNVVLREKKASEEKLETEVRALKIRIGGYNYRTVYEEKVRLERTRENLDKQINNMKGQKNELQNSIDELRRELALPDNKNAYAKYREQLYRLEIRKSVIKDLEKYIVALEKAVLEFHKSKMVQINRTIRHFWRNTYRGNDIDHIEIKTEYAAGTSTKRTYNYKVVQIKKGIELDMRGRCSAGQKVLACLLIRMALAETLSSNCGILALDEPTTNLDRANVFSLSDTLARIINNRHQEKTFQLIVITHDEEFLNALTRAQGTTHYYKVERDRDGYSVINRQQT